MVLCRGTYTDFEREGWIPTGYRVSTLRRNQAKFGRKDREFNRAVRKGP